MRILLANLKHLYQRRYLWFAYIFLAVMLIWALGWPGDDEVLALVWLLASFGGILMGGTTRDVMNKPFVRLLPGHPRVVRMVIFLVGLVVGTVVAFLLVQHGGVDPWGSPAIFWAAVCLGVTIYLIVAGFLLIPWMFKGPVASILFGLAFGAVLVTVREVYPKLEAIVISCPLWTILGGVLIGLAIWHQMGRQEWARRLFSLGLSFMASSKQRELYRDLERWFARGAGMLAFTESFFLARMAASREYGAARYIWGTLYVRFGSLAVWWKGLLLAWIAVTILSLYMGLGTAYLFVWVSLLIVPHAWPPLHSVTLVPAGRRERFLATVSLAAVIAGIMGLWIIVMSILSVPLSRLVPEVEIWDMSFVCRPVPIGVVSVPFIVVPLLATPMVLLPRRLHMVVYITAFVIVQPSLVTLLVITVWPSLLIDDVTIPGGPSFWIAMGIIVAWLLFFGACRYRTRRGALASQ
jgi:hypothetical protein